MILSIGLRALIITVAAAAAVFALFTMMYYLVVSDLAGLSDVPNPVRFDFVRLQKREITPPGRTLPQKTEQPKKPKMPQNRAQAESLTPGTPGFAFSAATPYKLDLLSGGDLSKGWAGSRDPLPIMRVTPIYPSRASRRGIEGWAEVMFTINTSGATEDVQIVAEDPAGIFGRTAVKAVRKWKYKPQVIDGKVQPRPNVRVLLKFQLEK